MLYSDLMEDRITKDLSAAAAADPQKDPSSQPFRRSILFIVLIAFLLRLAVITVGHTYRITPRRDHFQFAWEMGRIARSIATGHGFSSPTDLDTGPTAWMPPIYPYILAGIFKLFGVYSAASAWVILAFNSLAEALTCLTIYRIGERIFGVVVARASAWVWALFPYIIYWPVRVVYETSLSTFLLSLAVLLTLRLSDGTSRRRVWLDFGLLWGLIVLTNPALVSMLPFCLVFVLYQRPQQIAGGLLCVLTTALVVSPWLVRNYEVFGKFIFVRDNLPMELSMANNEESEGFWTRDQHPANDPATMLKFQQLGEAAFMRERGQEVRQFIQQHPARFAGFTLKRAMYFWISPPQAAIYAGYDFMVSRHVNFFLEAAFAFVGLWLGIRNRKHGLFLFACLLIIYPLPYYIVSPYPRYKHLIEPEMTLLIVYLFWESRRVQIHWPFHKTSA